MKLTRAGLLYILLTLLLGFAAVNTGNNLLYLMVSALLGFMVVSGILGKMNLSRLKVDCVAPAEVYDGVQTLLGIVLINQRRWLPVFLIEVVLDDQKVLFPVVDPGSSQRKTLTLVMHGRGLHEPRKLIVRSRFPINFFIREQGYAARQTILVFPRPRPSPLPLQPDPGGTRGSRQTRSRGQSGDIHRIRDYQGGESLRQIHWKLTARHDQLKIKELSATSRSPVVLDLNGLPGRGLEERLSRAAWLVIRMLREGRPVGLLAGAMEISPDTGPKHRLLLLQALAYYGQNKNAA